MHYDSSDRNWGLVQADTSGNGMALYYDRDLTGRIIKRERDTITGWNWSVVEDYKYGFTGSGDSPNFLTTTSGTVLEKYISLPGGASLTVKPTESQQVNKHSYRLPNIHGDTLLTTNGLGNNTSNGNGPANTFTYDPFGNILTGSNFPANVTGGSYGWAGAFQKATETSLSLIPVQMGARVYFPTLGRFAQVDLVDGGTLNNYVYAMDPVNQEDYSGRCIGAFSALMPLCAAALSVAASWLSGIKQTARSKTTAAKQSAVQQKPRTSFERAYVPLVPRTPFNQRSPANNRPPVQFNWSRALSSAQDSYVAGSTFGAVIGCGAGAIAMLGAAPVGCVLGGTAGNRVVGALGGAWGFLAGGFGLPGADDFEGAQDMPNMFKK